MRLDKLSLNQLRYDPEIGGFCAIATIEEGGIGYTYPVRFKATPSAEFKYVARGLAQEAARSHRHAPSREMRLRRSPFRPTSSPRSLLSRAGTPQPRLPGAAPAA